MAACAWEPRRIEALEGVAVADVAAGLDHSLILTANGELLSFGDGSLGALGRKRDATPFETSLVPSWHVRRSVASPCDGGMDTTSVVGGTMPSAHDLRIRSVAAGLGHCLAVTVEGEVLAWGWNGGGQLGLGPTFRHTDCVPTPHGISEMHIPDR